MAWRLSAFLVALVVLGLGVGCQSGSATDEGKDGTGAGDTVGDGGGDLSGWDGLPLDLLGDLGGDGANDLGGGDGGADSGDGLGDLGEGQDALEDSAGVDGAQDDGLEDSAADTAEDVVIQPPSCAFVPVVVGAPDADDDEDGFSENNGDCNDDDKVVQPGLAEVFDGKDNNCNGTIDEGLDGDCDGFKAAALGGDDCDDEDWQVNPAAEDDGADTRDDNCDGKFGDAASGDLDGDGFAATGTGGSTVDCDEADAFTFPGAAPGDGAAQCLRDQDNDGFGAASGGPEGGTDCDDQNPDLFPGAVEIPGDGVDQDCQGGDLIAATAGAAFVFVDGVDGLDTNAGTPAAPKKTLTAAVTLANATSRDLIVAQGDYLESLTFLQGRRLYGGFQAGTWARDPQAYKTRLLRPDLAFFVVKISAGTVRLDGLEVRNGQPSQVVDGGQEFSAVVVEASAGLVMQGCTVHGGTDVTAGATLNLMAVQIAFGGTGEIRESNLYGGVAPTGLTTAVMLGKMGYQGAPGVLKLHRSVLDGGESKHSSRAVVVAYECRAELVGNFIYGGKTNSGDSWSVEAMAPSTVVAVNNTIHGGQSGSNYGRAAAFASNSQSGGSAGDFTFINNILEGGQGYYSWGFASHTVSKVTLVGNNFHGNGTGENCAVGRWVSGLACVAFEAASINDCSQWPGAAACRESSGNLVGAPGVADFAARDFHLVAGSQAINAGVDPSWYFAGDAYSVDLDGQWRFGAGAIDIGADEYSAD
jgi:hypothetical protein